MAESKAQVDWERIEAEYRAGVLTLRQIASGHDISHVSIAKRAKKEGWDRNLQARIQAQAIAQVNKAQVNAPVNKVTENEVVAVNARMQADKILEHRKDLTRLRQLEEQLMEELSGGEDGNGPYKLYITQYQGQIVEKVVGLTVSEKASTLQSLAAVRAKRIELERKAFGMESEREVERSSGTVGDMSTAELEQLVRSAQQ